MNKATCEIGIAGLGTVGASLALSIADHGYSVAAYDRNETALAQLMLDIEGRCIEPAQTLEEFVSLLHVPRTVMIVLPAGLPVDDMIIGDEARTNGSGRWASLEARDLNVSTPTIDIALAIRMLSSLEEGRVALGRLFIRRPIRYVGKLDILIEQIKRALYAGMILTFAQGMALLRVASNVYKYDLALEDVARVWRGSIIRSPLLQDVCDAFYVQPHLLSLLSDPQFAHCLQARREDLRDVVRLSVEHGIPAPAFTASLVYYDAHRGSGPDDPQASARQLVTGLSENTKETDGSITTADAGNRSLLEKNTVRRIFT